jgi:hypothetical protein
MTINDHELNLASPCFHAVNRIDIKSEGLFNQLVDIMLIIEFPFLAFYTLNLYAFLAKFSRKNTENQRRAFPIGLAGSTAYATNLSNCESC